MGKAELTTSLSAPTLRADDAVGVPCWYIAITRHNAERTAAAAVNRLGIPTYLPLQQRISVWRDGRRRKVDTPVIPGILFVHATEPQRLAAVNLPQISRFMTDRARGPRHLAIVPDRQIEALRFMVGNSDTPVTIAPIDLQRGDNVTIARGRLAGLTGTVTYPPQREDLSTATVTITIDHIGCASVTLPLTDLTPTP